MDELSNYSKNLTVQTFDKNIKPSFHLFVININFKKIKKTKDYFIKYFVKKKYLLSNIISQFINLKFMMKLLKIFLDQKNILKIQLVFQFLWV